MRVVLPFYILMVNIIMRTSILMGGVRPLVSRPRSPYGVVCWVVLLGLVASMDSSARSCAFVPLIWRRVSSTFQRFL
jgi:hypothetical protein